jgi:putative DNA primase/helicase
MRETNTSQHAEPQENGARCFNSIEATFQYIIGATLAELQGTGKHQGHCPSFHHENGDRNPSLSIWIDEKGDIALNCFGCGDRAAICESLKITESHLYRNRYEKTQSTITVASLARDKRLTEEFLVARGVRDSNSNRYVTIPYLDETGQAVVWERKRHAPNAKAKFSCKAGTKPRLYGLLVLKHARKQRCLIIVEGESDCWTLWHHQIPAVGVPGATSATVVEAVHLEEIEILYVFREPDKGGDTFVDGIAKRLQALGYKGTVRVVSLDGFKDPSAMHIALVEERKEVDRCRSEFTNRLVKALGAARPIEDVLKEIGSAKTHSKGDGNTETIEDILKNSGLLSLTTSADITEVEAALRNLRVRGCDELQHALVREAAINQLKNIGVNSPSRLVDAALGTSQKVEDTSALNAGIIFPEVEPWPESVDGAALLEDIAALFRRFVVMSKGVDTTLALWVLHSLIIDAFDASPFLVASSPQKRCGKSLVKELLELLIARALSVSHISPAALYRTIEECKPILLLDEGDTFIKDNEQLRGILNSRYQRGSSYIIRMEKVGDKYVPRRFSTWCAMFIALIGELPTTVEDRSIIIPMRRKTRHEKVERWSRKKFEKDESIIALGRKCVRWAGDHFESLRSADDPSMPNALNDRAQDNWRPLFIIADTVGGVWPAKVREATLLLSGQHAEDGDTAVQLLIDIKNLFESQQADNLLSTRIVDELGKMEDRPWPEWKHGKPITPQQLAALLKPFEIRPRQIWAATSEQQLHNVMSNNMRGYRLEDFEDAFSRYISACQTARGARM